MKPKRHTGGWSTGPGQILFLGGTVRYLFQRNGILADTPQLQSPGRWEQIGVRVSPARDAACGSPVLRFIPIAGATSSGM
jgi:hypothetical protein